MLGSAETAIGQPKTLAQFIWFQLGSSERHGYFEEYAGLATTIDDECDRSSGAPSFCAWLAMEFRTVARMRVSARSSHSGFAAALEQWFVDWGEFVLDSVSAVGDFALFCARTFQWLVLKCPRRSVLLPNFYQVGVRSLPVIALTGTFIGMVLAVQSYFQFRQLGLETRLGAVINMSLVRELGPVLAATMLAGRVGSAMAAELGTMRVTEQIDALAAMGANPIQYLVVPRFLASVFLIPALTVMADFMGIVGGYFYCVIILGIDAHHYYTNSAQFVGGFDLFTGIFKSVFFGGTISLISCYRGFYSAGGAEGVGRAATAAFVYSFVLILAEDLLFNIVLDAIYHALWPQGAKLI